MHVRLRTCTDTTVPTADSSGQLMHARVNRLLIDKRTVLCRDHDMHCNQQEFWFINSCEEMSKQFPCEQGCAVELGNDVPNYVNDASLGSHQTCLVNQKQPKCDAANPSTLRLCPCVPTQ